MQRRHTDFKYLYYTDEQLLELINQELNNPSFRDHCNAVAIQQNISPTVVEDVLKDMAFKTLKLLQEKAAKKKRIKISILGFFSFQIRTKSNFKFIKVKRS